jgi:hypothetical protein
MARKKSHRKVLKLKKKEKESDLVIKSVGFLAE